jgi:hypothetical protein
MAKIARTIEVAPGDLVEPYAMFTNGHGGPFPLTICLTTVRIVCQNTLNLALRKAKKPFRRAHKGTVEQHAAAAEAFWKSTLQQCDEAEATFQAFAKSKCTDAEFDRLVDTLLPLPSVPHGAPESCKAAARAAKQIEKRREQRDELKRLRGTGQGAQLDSARGTLWGALNAVTEFIDHSSPSQSGSISNLLGSGMMLKQKAYKLILALYDQSA